MKGYLRLIFGIIGILFCGSVYGDEKLKFEFHLSFNE